LKTYELEFHEAALKEWRKLDGSVQTLFKKQLAKRLQAPHVPTAKLHGELKNT
jgi:mRNA interferase RelE/StbE